MVTKQQQLEWLANKIVKWPAYGPMIPVSVDDAGNPKFYMPWDTVRVDCTREEWQQERDKMSSKPEVDNSWYERGELPPVGVYCHGHVTQEDKWIQIEVIAHREGHVLGWANGEKRGFSANNVKCFRPLRTEREKAIDELASVSGIRARDGAREIAERIYDAGYRKVKP